MGSLRGGGLTRRAAPRSGPDARSPLPRGRPPSFSSLVLLQRVSQLPAEHGHRLLPQRRYARPRSLTSSARHAPRGALSEHADPRPADARQPERAELRVAAGQERRGDEQRREGAGDEPRRADDVRTPGTAAGVAGRVWELHVESGLCLSRLSVRGGGDE